jgi:hypothetical protein
VLRFVIIFQLSVLALLALLAQVVLPMVEVLARAAR